MLGPNITHIQEKGQKRELAWLVVILGAEREKATPEGPLRDLVFIRIVLGIAVFRFYVFFLGESCHSLHWEKFPAFSKELVIVLVLLLFSGFLYEFCDTF